MAFRELLIALDGSNLAETALYYAREIAVPGAHIRLLSVIDRKEREGLTSVANSVEIALTGAPAFPAVPTVTQAEEIREMTRYLEAVKARVEQGGYEVTIEVVPGPVSETISAAVAERECDVLVMTTHGRSGFSRLLFGSVAESVLHKVSCPVFLIPAKATEL